MTINNFVPTDRYNRNVYCFDLLITWKHKLSNAHLLFHLLFEFQTTAIRPTLSRRKPHANLLHKLWIMSHLTIMYPQTPPRSWRTTKRQRYIDTEHGEVNRIIDLEAEENWAYIQQQILGTETRKPHHFMLNLQWGTEEYQRCVLSCCWRLRLACTIYLSLKM